MNKRIYIHTHLHNNSFQPDSSVLAKIENEIWKEDYDFETLSTRYLGNNLYIIISIPHFIYGYQRYDQVKVEEKTSMITSLEHRGRNTSVRLAFLPDSTSEEKKAIMDKLIELGCVLDIPYLNMLAIDFDEENSRNIISNEMNKLLEDKKILDWEYVIQDEGVTPVI